MKMQMPQIVLIAILGVAFSISLLSIRAQDANNGPNTDENTYAANEHVGQMDVGSSVSLIYQGRRTTQGSGANYFYEPVYSLVASDQSVKDSLTLRFVTVPLSTEAKSKAKDTLNTAEIPRLTPLKPVGRRTAVYFEGRLLHSEVDSNPDPAGGVIQIRRERIPQLFSEGSPKSVDELIAGHLLVICEDQFRFLIVNKAAAIGSFGRIVTQNVLETVKGNARRLGSGLASEPDSVLLERSIYNEVAVSKETLAQITYSGIGKLDENLKQSVENTINSGLERESEIAIGDVSSGLAEYLLVVTEDMTRLEMKPETYKEITSRTRTHELNEEQKAQFEKIWDESARDTTDAGSWYNNLKTKLDVAGANDGSMSLASFLSVDHSGSVDFSKDYDSQSGAAKSNINNAYKKYAKETGSSVVSKMERSFEFDGQRYILKTHPRDLKVRRVSKRAIQDSLVYIADQVVSSTTTISSRKSSFGYGSGDSLVTVREILNGINSLQGQTNSHNEELRMLSASLANTNGRVHSLEQKTSLVAVDGHHFDIRGVVRIWNRHAPHTKYLQLWNSGTSNIKTFNDTDANNQLGTNLYGGTIRRWND